LYTVAQLQFSAQTSRLFALVLPHIDYAQLTGDKFSVTISGESELFAVPLSVKSKKIKCLRHMGRQGR